jgi:hypothetical protein
MAQERLEAFHQLLTGCHIPLFVAPSVAVLRPGTIGAFLLALGSVGAARALRLAIDPYMEGVPAAV